MRPLLVALLLALECGGSASAFAQFGETVDVVRYVIPVRVVDPAGRAVRGLTPADFTATLGGKKAVVESVDWIGSRGEDTASSHRGRLVVIFVQTDFARNAARVKGQMHFITMARRVLDTLEPEDLVAVVSQDSHLKVQCDFTLDRNVAYEAVRDALGIREQTLPPAPETGPSLVRHLDEQEIRNAATIGTAMHVVARALLANEGEKVVIHAGWGIGQDMNGFVVLDQPWRDAMALFRGAHVPVITLGTGLGGTLTAGMMATSKETGGFYATTQTFPDQSIDRVRGMLSGQYELVLRIEGELAPGEYRVDVRTSRANATVLASSMTVGASQPVAPPATQPTDASAVYREALQKLREGDAEGAETLLTEAIGLKNAPAESWYERALLRAGRGETAQAVADLRVYLERAPGGQHASEARELLASWE